MSEQVRVTGDFVVELHGRARIVVLPISPADEAWCTAFHNALPTQKHAWRITASRDVIRIAVESDDQLVEFISVVAAAIDRVNRKAERLEAAVRRARRRAPAQ